MTNIADTLQKIDTIASQRGQQDELTSLIIHALKQLNGGAKMTMKASPLERDEFRFGHILRWRSNWRIRPVRRC
jgi:hypothetical protein